MSSKKPASRFSGQLSNLAGRPAPEPVQEQKVKQQSKESVGKGQSVPQEDVLETFSSHMLRNTKRRLKMAAAKEERNQYEIVGELVEAWLAEKHPEL